MSIKYPTQATAVKREEKVLAVDTQLSVPGKDDSTPPLEIHSGFSRFVLTIVDTSGKNTLTPKANILAKEVGYIREQTNFAMQYLFDKRAGRIGTPTQNKTDEIITGPAYTQKLFDNKFKGRTPAEVLLANAGEKDNLIKTRDWLNANLAKYPKNKAQIDAIDNALELLEIGELKGDTATACATEANSIILFSTPDGKHFTTQRNEKGYNLCYKLVVTFNPNMNYPFNIKITNMYAPIETGKNGKKTAKLSSAMDTITSNINLAEEEWDYLSEHMYDTLKCFEQLNYRNQYLKAIKLADEAHKSRTK